MKWFTEDLEVLHLGIPTKEVLTKVASLGKGEFVELCNYTDFRGFLDGVPGARGESEMGQYLIVQDWALGALFLIQKVEMKEMRTWLHMEPKSQKGPPSMVDKKKWEKADGAKAENEAVDMVKLKDEGMAIFEGDNLIAF
ncbi:hypothetical protein ACHAP5_009363 [Fusarium lateritium]